MDRPKYFPGAGPPATESRPAPRPNDAAASAGTRLRLQSELQQRRKSRVRARVACVPSRLFARSRAAPVSQTESAPTATQLPRPPARRALRRPIDSAAMDLYRGTSRLLLGELEGREARWAEAPRAELKRSIRTRCCRETVVCPSPFHKAPRPVPTHRCVHRLPGHVRSLAPCKPAFQLRRAGRPTRRQTSLCRPRCLARRRVATARNPAALGAPTV